MADEVAKEVLKEVGKAAVKEAWEKKWKVLEWIGRLSTWLGFAKAAVPDHTKAGILVLGLGGSGKTRLARLLSGDFEMYLGPPGGYESSLKIEEYSLLGEPEVEIIVPPGQEHRRAATWDELLQDTTDGRFRGLILVTSYGHESFGRPSCRDHPLFRTRKDDFLSELLEKQRGEEVALFERLTPVLLASPERFWLLSVVTKQDVWWPDHPEVERFLHHGIHSERLGADRGCQTWISSRDL